MDHFFDYESKASCACCDEEMSKDNEVVCELCFLDGWRWCVVCKRVYLGHAVEEYEFCMDCSSRLSQLSKDDTNECPF